MIEVKGLSSIADGSVLAELGRKKLKAIQRSLSIVGFPVGDIDGLIGPKTRNAWAELKLASGDGDPAIVSKASLEFLIERIEEINKIVTGDLGSRKRTMRGIAALCEALDIGMREQISYVLATTQWETAHTFEPVKEAFWLSENWRRNNLRYYPYYGRGYVQLTWDNNYKAYGDILDRSMLDDPDIALEPAVALFTLVHGFKTGTFTGRKITEFINAVDIDFVNARRCINGRDKAFEIRDLALDFLDNL